VRKLQEPGADEGSRTRRCGLLQRVIYVAFTRVIGRSRIGFRVEVNGQKTLAFPRVLLNICDQPEERAVLGLKASQYVHPCTACMAKVDIIGAAEAVDAKDRNVINTITNQVEAYKHTRRQRQRQRRVALGALDSTSGGVPSLAGMAGLGTAHMLLYKMIGSDVLHVRFPSLLILRCMGAWKLYTPSVGFSLQSVTDGLFFHALPPLLVSAPLFYQVLDLGVTRTLVHRLVRVFPYLCKGKKPPAGSGTATRRIAFRRLLRQSRRSKACRTPPGYVRIFHETCSPLLSLLPLHLFLPRPLDLSLPHHTAVDLCLTRISVCTRCSRLFPCLILQLHCASQREAGGVHRQPTARRRRHSGIYRGRSLRPGWRRGRGRCVCSGALGGARGGRGIGECGRVRDRCRR